MSAPPVMVFDSLDSRGRGSIYDALAAIYSDFPFPGPEQESRWRENWREYDQLIHDNPDTVGKAGFISTIRGAMAGFCSWDPRNGPAYAIVGHNGILPVHRGHGYGKVQIERMLAILKGKGFQRAHVTTGDDAFFLPARKMYESCGFVVCGRTLHIDGKVVNYEIGLGRRA